MRANTIRPFILALAIIAAFALPSSAAVMEDYCVVPPYVKTDIPPNIYIIMDNSRENGMPAYRTGTEDPVQEGFLTYVPGVQSVGLFREDLWYRYDGSVFTPDPDGAFSGNFLNWATSSVYDVITSIIEGGNSSPTAGENVNTLTGYAGKVPWDGRMIVYTGENAFGTETLYACEIWVNTNPPSSDLTPTPLLIRDSNTYLNDYGVSCGLIDETPVRPLKEDPSVWTEIVRSPVRPGQSAMEQYAKGVFEPNADIIEKIDNTIGRAEFSRRLASAMASFDEAAADSPVPARKDGVREMSFAVMDQMLGYVSDEAHAAIKITSPAGRDPRRIPDAEVYVPYPAFQAYADGFQDPPIWAVANLPSGLFINATNGAIYGTVDNISFVGQHEFELTVTDSKNASRTLTIIAVITVQGRDLKITAPTDGGYVHDISSGKDYKGFQAKAIGGDVSMHTFSIEPPDGAITDPVTGEYTNVDVGSDGDFDRCYPLPSTITIDPFTGFISGNIDHVATNTLFAFKVKVSDTYTDTSVLTFMLARGRALEIQTKPPGGIFPTAYYGKPYGPVKLSATGGSGNYYWQVPKSASLTDGTLPTGMYSSAGGWGYPWEIDGGVIQGTPTGGAMTYNFTAKVTDNITGAEAFSDKIYSPYMEYSMTLEYPDDFYVKLLWPPHGNYLDPDTGELIPEIGESYPDYAFTVHRNQSYPNGVAQGVATGGTGTYTWYLFPLDIDLGLMIDNSTGVIYNWPLDLGAENKYANYGIAVESDGFVDYREFTVRYFHQTWNPFFIGRPTQDYRTPSSAEGKVGVPFTYGPLVTFGTSPHWCTVDTDIPGLLFDMEHCIYTGKPTKAGTYPVTFTVEDGVSAPATRVVNIIINRLDDPEIVGVNYGQTIAQVWQGIEFEYQFNGLGGVEPYTWSIQPLPSGPDADHIEGLPPGLSFHISEGRIFGEIPDPAPLKYHFMVRLTDDRGYYTEKDVKLTTTGRDANIRNIYGGGVLPEGTLGIEYDGFTVIGMGGVPYTYTFIARNLPQGMDIDPNTGLIGGTPAGEEGTYTDIELCIKDVAGVEKCKYGISITLRSLTVLREEEYAVKVDAGDYDDPTSGTRSGVIRSYYCQKTTGCEPDVTKAFFGVINFKDTSPYVPQVKECILPKSSPPANDVDIHTGVQNSKPVAATSRLVDGLYMAVGMFFDNPGLDMTFPKSEQPSCKDLFGGDDTPCRQNFILMVTSGTGADNPPNPDSTLTPYLYEYTHSGDFPADCAALTSNLAKNACFGYQQADFRPDVKGAQKISTYVVNAMGEVGSEETLKETAESSGGLYYYADNPAKLKKQLEQAFEDIIKRATSGTAASVLASGEGSGANIIQAIYYPKRRFVDSQTGQAKEISWIGKLSGFWYYSDPFYADSDIREDTQISDPHTLDLVEDYIIQPFFNTVSEKVEANRAQDSNASGGYDEGEEVDVIDFEQVTPLWEAGRMLWDRDLGTEARTIWVNVDDSHTMTPFTVSEVQGNETLRRYMQAGSIANGVGIANFVHGYEVYGARDRTVKLDMNGDGDTSDTGETEARVWKLGDVLNSSPVVSAAGVPNNKYQEIYGVVGYMSGETTYDAYTESDAYNNRGMVYAGGNDGMLHAFKLGYLAQNVGANIKATLYNSPDHTSQPTEEPLGYEMWAFMPKNVLPYLKYTLDRNYCHIYMVDQTVTLVDASLCASTLGGAVSSPNAVSAAECSGSNFDVKGWDSWRTVLIGGMRNGGACKEADFVCNSANGVVDANGDNVIDDRDCVKAPITNTPEVGLSSYFALDITDEDNPVLLWEFTDPKLGFSTSGPTVVRFNGTEGSAATLGHWYVIFGSGPTGPIDVQGRQFVGASDQPLRFFVLDLKTGEPPTGMGTTPYLETGIPYAYITSMGKVSNDFNVDYQTDVIYAGYTSRCAGEVPPMEAGQVVEWLDTNIPCPVGTWRNGGVARILTDDNPDPTQWKIAKVIENIGPVTGSLGRLQNTKNNEVWLYVGTGRYSYQRKEPWRVAAGFTNAVADDRDGMRNILGFMDPCATGGTATVPFPEVTCQDMVSFDSLKDVTFDPFNTDRTTGWYVYLDPPMQDTETGMYFGAERVITDVRTSLAGLVYVTSFKPYADECSIGGETYMWVFDYDTGAAPDSIKGVAIMQVSTGNIEKIDLSEAFTEAGGRKTKGKPGVSSQDSASFSDPGGGAARMLHILERQN